MSSRTESAGGLCLPGQSPLADCIPRTESASGLCPGGHFLGGDKIRYDTGPGTGLGRGGSRGGVGGLQPPLSYMVTPPLLLNSPSPFPAFCIAPEALDSNPPPPPLFVSGLKRTAPPPPPPRISYRGSQPPLLENPVSAPVRAPVEGHPCPIPY